jgi:hypothetical protein
MIAVCLSYAPSDLNEMLSLTPINGGLATGGGLSFAGIKKWSYK